MTFRPSIRKGVQYIMKKATQFLYTILCTAFLLSSASPVRTAAAEQIPPQKMTVQQGIYEIVSAVDTDLLLDTKYCT